MLEEKLLTKKDLAERWQVSERTIDQYREDGIITPVKGLPCIRFNSNYIAKIEGNIPEKVTMRERKLEREIEQLKQENRLLKQVWLRIFSESASVAHLIK